MKIEAHLVEIQNQRTLTKAQDPDFFYVLQRACFWRCRNAAP